MNETHVSIVVAESELLGTITGILRASEQFEFIDSVILFTNQSTQFSKKQIGEHRNIQVMYSSEEHEKGKMLKIGARQSTSPMVAVMNRFNQNSYEELELALNQMGDSDILLGVSERKRDHRIISLAKHLLQCLIGLVVGFEIREVDPDFCVVRTDFVCQHEKILPDDSSFLPVLMAIAERTRRRIGYQKGIIQEAQNTVSVRKYVFLARKLLHYGIFYNPKRIFFPLGVLICVYGMIVSVQEADSNNGISTNGILIVVAGIVILVLATISQVISDAVLGLDR